jgi:hypothetical protein
MTLNRARVWGIILTIIGVVLAILFSLTLASQAETGGSLVLGGIIGFAVVAPFIIGGVYQFWRGTNTEIELNAEMPAQRELMDRLRERPNSLSELAKHLQLAPDEVLSIIEQLHKLDLFHGYRTPEGQIIYVDMETIRSLTRCAVCSTAIKGLPQQVVTCPKCGSEYYL